MKVFGLRILQGNAVKWEAPIVYSTDILKLRKLMVDLTGTHVIQLGSTDVTNEPEMNCHTELGKVPFGKISEMPTLL